MYLLAIKRKTSAVSDGSIVLVALNKLEKLQNYEKL
jgi:hypothetical protein